MAIQSLDIPAQRIGASLGRILGHAQPKIVLGTVGMTDSRKKNTGATVKYRRWLPKGATTSAPNIFFPDSTGADRGATYVQAQQTSEGVTPNAESLTPQDFSVSQLQFSVLYGFTDQTADLSEDIIPKVMEEMVGERTGLICEMQLFGVLKGCTNKFYGGTGTSRATVNGTLTLQLLRRVARSLMANHAEPVRRMFMPIPANGNYNTAPIGGYCFPVFIHTDLAADVRDLPNFTPVERYPDATKAVENEFGRCEEFRFIASPDLISVQDGGAAIAGVVPALKSLTGTSADVYQVVVGSQDAWGHVGLQGFDKDNITLLPTGQKDKADPHGQRGYVGSIFYYNAVRLNEGQMAVIEVAANALTS